MLSTRLSFQSFFCGSIRVDMVAFLKAGEGVIEFGLETPQAANWTHKS